MSLQGNRIKNARFSPLTVGDALRSNKIQRGNERRNHLPHSQLQLYSVASEVDNTEKSVWHEFETRPARPNSYH